MAATGQDKTQPGDLAAFRELIRNAAKWFVAGLGAIGAVLIAGSQLSSLGALPAGSARFYAAIGGVIAGLVAILWAMWRVVDVLSPKPWTFDDVVSEWNATEGQCEKRRRRARRVGCYLRTHLHILGNYQTVPEIKKDYDESEPDREGLSDLVQLMNGIVEKAATIDLQQRFQALRYQIAAGVLVGAAGIVLFAWAANPAKPEQPAPSLRNANLRNADLRGASLRNADLTGADLTGANLHDADLRGATITDTVWSDTTCPDGVNSDSTARTNERGNLSGGTCEGHLLPPKY